MKGRITIDREICKGCALCMNFCPKGQIQISKDLNKKGYYPAEFKENSLADPDSAHCTGCALCAVTCPDIAIEVYREQKEGKGPNEQADQEERTSVD